jgi:N-sulfoglucosamine sulfohydrolase
MNPLRSICLAALAILPLAAAQSAAFAAPRNIVLIVTDDQSPDLGCYGNKVIQTSNIDALAADGIRLTHAFCTTASCSASRSVILTGMHNHANGHYGHAHDYHHFSLQAGVQTLPMRLAGAGYRTAQCGKIHVEPAAAVKFQETLQANARSTVEMAEKCRDFVSAKSDKPFFLYFCPTDPHRDGQSVADDPQKPNSFGNRAKAYPGVTEVKYKPADVIVPPFLPDSPTCRAELAQYYQSISRIDQGIGRLVEILKEAKIYDDTLLIFTADHGMAFPGAKTTCYEPGLHVPFIAKLPAADKLAGRTSDAMISFVDIVPTLLDFAQVPPEKDILPKFPVQGRSFLKAIREEHPKGWDEIYASHTFHEITMYYPMRVVRTRKHKLIWNIAHSQPFPFASDLWEAPTWQAAFKQGPETLYGKRTVQQYIQRPEFELYDLAADPDEIANLADKPAHAELFAELKGKLKTFQKNTRDPWILKWDYE